MFKTHFLYSFKINCLTTKTTAIEELKIKPTMVYDSFFPFIWKKEVELKRKQFIQKCLLSIMNQPEWEKQVSKVIALFWRTRMNTRITISLPHYTHYVYFSRHRKETLKSAADKKKQIQINYKISILTSYIRQLFLLRFQRMIFEFDWI